MEKDGKKKKQKKPNKTEQYERFKKTARELGIDNDEAATENLEKAFKKIVPAKHSH